MSPVSFLSLPSSRLPPAEVELCWPHAGGFFHMQLSLILIFILTLKCGVFVFLSLFFCPAEPGLTLWLLQASFLGDECRQKAV